MVNYAYRVRVLAAVDTLFDARHPQQSIALADIGMGFQK